MPCSFPALLFHCLVQNFGTPYFAAELQVMGQLSPLLGSKMFSLHITKQMTVKPGFLWASWWFTSKSGSWKRKPRLWRQQSVILVITCRSSLSNKWINRDSGWWGAGEDFKHWRERQQSFGMENIYISYQSAIWPVCSSLSSSVSVKEVGFLGSEFNKRRMQPFSTVVIES